MTRIRKTAVSTMLYVAASLGVNATADDGSTGIRRVLVISIDGMHSLDFALWVKNNPTSAIAQLAARGINFSNASSSKPSDSIPATTAIFTGGTPAVTGMWYDDAYNRSWFAPANTTCTGTPGTTFSLKGDIDVNPQPTTVDPTNQTVDPNKSPRQLVAGVCTPVLPHNMIHVNTAFEVVRAAKLGRTAYSDKTATYEFLNGPSGTGIVDLYTPEIGTAILKDPVQTMAFDDLRVTSILNEIKGYDHSGTTKVGVPMLFGMNFQAINAGKKDSLGGGYADGFGTPNATLLGTLQHTDASIGQIVAALQTAGITNSTAIILLAKHGESSLDPSERVISLTSAIQGILTPAGFPSSGIPKITEKTTALIWLKDQTQTTAVASVLTLAANEQALHVQQILTGESLKLLFADPLVDPSTPDLIVIPSNGTNYEPSLSTALPAVQAEHGGFNENETHVPLLVVSPFVTPGQVKAPVTLTQVAPTILTLLGIDPTLLQAVKLEGATALPGVKKVSTDN